MNDRNQDAGLGGPAWTPWCEAHTTHSGSVVLMGDLAFKFKRPVTFGFLDFTDRDVRERTCEREVELNRRLSPDVYLGVGQLIDPGGQVEPAVVMRRLPDRYRLAHLVRSGLVTADDLQAVARSIAIFHAGATTTPEVARHGTRDALGARWAANLGEMAAMPASGIDRSDLDEITALVRSFLAGRQELFADRIRRGAVVDGHGDLTPDDIFCMPDGPRLLDCLEFDDALRSVDRLDDVAFLAMGLAELGATDSAQSLLDTWAECVGDPAPPSLIHHFIAYRAFVRAKVGCLDGAQESRAAVGRYVETTLAHLRAGSVKLVLIGGSPGSGKTTLAGALADHLGMVVVSSDRLRKELAGIDPRASAASGIGAGIYDPVHTRDTYGAMLDRARLLLRLGESVVLDASWSSATERSGAAELAQEAAAELVELRCSVDQQTARTRIRSRESLSDADELVEAALRACADPWPSSHVIDTLTPLGDCVERASGLIRPHPSPWPGWSIDRGWHPV